MELLLLFVIFDRIKTLAQIIDKQGHDQRIQMLVTRHASVMVTNSDHRRASTSIRFQLVSLSSLPKELRGRLNRCDYKR